LGSVLGGSAANEMEMASASATMNDASFMWLLEERPAQPDLH
jgi:hypothetical protein